MLTLDSNGQKVRGFKVLIQTPEKMLSLPCTGCGLYTGEQALDVMRLYVKKNWMFEVRAYTLTTCGTWERPEQLTLAEMETIYDGKP